MNAQAATGKQRRIIPLRVVWRILVPVAILLVIGALWIGPSDILGWGMARDMKRQMQAGKQYMDSLSAPDMQAWIERSRAILQEPLPDDGVGVYSNYAPGKPLPDDLKKLKILRVDHFKNQVDYIWCGGFDHTELEVIRSEDGSFKVVAMYDDSNSKVLWP
ncbi:MAG TPA: hypothetical protein VG733_02840 [Chthoniobacteraceae bacterium]|nr:hypothetical protein [Chthoniobacteraceae bacterium]